MPTDLLNSARNNDLPSAIGLLDAGADVNGRGEHGFTPLHCAAEQGHEAMVRLLLGRGADPTIVAGAGYDEYTALPLAAGNGHLPVVRLIVERRKELGAELDSGVDYSHFNPLHMAAVRGHTHVAEYLLEQGFDHTDAWTLAGQGADPNVLKLLLKHREIAPAQMQAALQASSKQSYYQNRFAILAAVELLLHFGATLPTNKINGQPQLWYVARAGLIETIPLLLQRHAARHPLWAAVCDGDLRGVEKWLSAPEPPEVVADTIEDASDQTFNVDYALLLAAASNKQASAAIARRLLDHGADARAFATHHEVAPLAAAVLWGHPDTANILRDHGSDINDADKYGRTSLIQFLTRLPPDAEGLDRLIAHGADVNAMPGSCTALSEAVRLSQTETVRLLLERGADPNQNGVFGPEKRACLSPLLCARWFKYSSIEKMLLEAGATE